MLFVTVIQVLAVGFTLTSLIKNTLMVSREQNGVTCNITSNIYPVQRIISAEHLCVYWGWQALEVRWDFKGATDTQIWVTETYKKTYDYRCKPTVPTPSPILHPKTPTPKPTKTPTNHTTYKPTQTPTNYSSYYSSYYNQRKLLQYESYQNNEELSFEVPLSLQYNSVLTTRSFLPSIFYPLPPLQMTGSYGQEYVEYVYPFKITKIYRNNNQNITSSSPTSSPTHSTKDGCDDLDIVIETGKSYFSLLVCGLLCSSIGLILLIAPTCHLVNIKTRRLLKQIIIALNTLSFMLLLMAFAIWFAYFSTNINQVIEAESSNTFSVCMLGSPGFGESIAYLLSGWLLIGFATMSACYLSNRPKRWYRFLRKKRGIIIKHNKLNINNGVIHGINGSIKEESMSDIDDTDDDYDDDDDDDNDTDDDDDDIDDDDDDIDDDNDNDPDTGDSTDDSQENQRLDTLMHRTPSNNSSGSNDTYMTADGSFGNVIMKGDAYPVTYSPLG